MAWREGISDEQYFAANGSTAADAAVVAEFRRVIAPLEEKQGRTLDGWGWRKCLRSFVKNEEGFRRLAAALATREGVRSPLGVLIYAVDGGELDP